MNLTVEQRALLTKIIDFHRDGCTAGFLVNRTMTGTSLICMENRCPKVSITPAMADFLQLQKEEAIQLTQNAQGMLFGKSTQRGIDLVKRRGGRPQDEQLIRKMVVALQRAITATFNADRWLELGQLTDSTEVIQEHSRLLRSLYFCDDDYTSSVADVLPKLLGPGREHLDAVEEFVGLREWLWENDRKLYGQVYANGLMPLEYLEDASALLNIAELGRHAQRIRDGIRDDPARAIGSAKELLETVLRSIIGDHAQKPQADIPTLLKQAQQVLGIDPKAVSRELPGAETLSRTLTSLGQVVVGVAELRTLYGTGHGRSRGRELEVAHARLVVNAAVTVATFLVEVWAEEHTGARAIRAERSLAQGS